MFSPAQMIQSLMQRSGHLSAARPVEFTPGQVFTGAILRTYPENMALVQIGGMQLQAKLEASLEAGQRAWLQVQPSHGGVITLKVLSAPQGGAVADASLDGLMKSLGIADTKENRSLVQALVSANLPVNREAAQSFAAVTQRLGADQGTLDAFLLSLRRNLPVTPDAIAGLKAFLAEKPLSQTIQAFLREADSFLRGHQVPPAAGNGTGSPATAAGGGQLQTIVAALRDKLAQLAYTLPQQDASASGESGKTQAAQQGTPANGSGTLAGGSASTLARGAETGSSAQPMKSGSAGPEGLQANAAGQGALNRPGAETGKAGEAPLPRTNGTGSADLSGMSSRNVGEMSGADTAKSNAGGDQSQTAPIAATAPGTGGQAPHSAAAGRPDHPILELFRQLGLGHEREVASQALTGTSEILKHMETAKSLLLQLSSGSHSGVPAALRDAADTLLQQITGQQLMLAQPSHQPFAQVVMQIPIRTQDGEDTAFVQIESKKKGGGELDPENCRLFFNLDLNKMGITLLDVAIVNRIVNIQVFNNSEWVEPLVHAMRDELVGQLQGIGYQLSSMRVQAIPEAKGDSPARMAAKSKYQLSDYKGVDFRV
ncbi:hypothetical protein KDJ56_09350 [Brevibacillus composti]|uniref:Flagellar hook-length control protein FliK n=1 Tax=Brevibacillus composti TaxID=2796470 RepID=A0A7T5ENX1_9BACL|nr:hypothetical protein [Brevibacillus composti]QQE76098.1 hypothetical protein JD108_09655 [Brevibacillus composti]QUO43127.1 hypothetical protein KDJ56_09350 [Brevibacillus composti]